MDKKIMGHSKPKCTKVHSVGSSATVKKGLSGKMQSSVKK